MTSRQAAHSAAPSFSLTFGAAKFLRHACMLPPVRDTVTAESSSTGLAWLGRLPTNRLNEELSFRLQSSLSWVVWASWVRLTYRAASIVFDSTHRTVQELSLVLALSEQAQWRISPFSAQISSSPACSCTTPRLVGRFVLIISVLGAQS